ncbi:protein limb expression 1 homolog isoform X1 [Gadus morhua]|uniref:protein limb expression 1 homolog isoform X1 n=2 Tax=Gadus morhua TaxID=8049 RepID=UPI0011B473AF|nr:protein limb expression 1 homolog isoform X1 [Gadus morhua]
MRRAGAARVSSEETQENIMMSHLLKSESGNSPQDLNVVAMLHHFWQKKQSVLLTEGGAEDPRAGQGPLLLLYESAPTPGPPYVCYVTLPGGSCFGNYRVCETQAEARRDAARVALMNSLMNELPSRQISPPFISQSLRQAAADSAVSLEDACDPGTSIGTYSLLLHSCTGRTMLEFQEMMTVFQLLHWNGTLKSLKDQQCSRRSVISYFSERGLDESLRSSMALDWLERERRAAGRLAEQLAVAQRELVLARRRGVELRFYKEKTEILSLALSQAYTHHPHHPHHHPQHHQDHQQYPDHPDPYAPSPGHESAGYAREEELHLRPPPIYETVTLPWTTPPGSPSPSLR